MSDCAVESSEAVLSKLTIEGYLFWHLHRFGGRHKKGLCVCACACVLASLDALCGSSKWRPVFLSLFW